MTTTFVFVELEGEHRFRVTCPQGHSSVIGLRQARFKILYESGALALLDGYYREAVASVAASLERFHEHWVRDTLLQKGISSAAVGETWRLVASQSERQYGAFLWLYLSERNQVPPHLPDKWVQFRNDVVHRGEFPAREKASEYAEHVLSLIAPLNRELQQAAPQGVAALAEEQARTIEAEGGMAATIKTMLGRATDMLPTKPSFQDELQLLDARRRGAGG